LKIMDLTNLHSQSARAEDLEKTAELELFCKLAAQQNIDLSKMDDDSVLALYSYTFNKTAEEEPAAKDEDEKEDEEKKEAAAREHATKLAFAKEAAQADELGRRMAHSYVDELNKIGSALQAAAAEAAVGTQETDETKEAGIKDSLGKGLSAVKNFGGKAVDKIRHADEIVGGKARKLVGDMPAGKAARSAEGQAQRTKNVGRAVLGGGAALAAGGGAAAFGGKKKESSALDQLALEQAVKIAAASNFDPEEAAERVMAVATLGLDESTKVASDLAGQVEIRALEFLEAAGYPVEWTA
jgi:hypothetical protein